MGLSDYAYMALIALFVASGPVVSKEMPVHDWLWNYYADDKHLGSSDPEPSTKQGSGVFEDYVAVVEQRGTFFT